MDDGLFSAYGPPHFSLGGFVTDPRASNRFTFFGKVHPERCNVSFPELHLQLFLATGQLVGELRYSISFSQVTATFIPKAPIDNV